MTMACVSIDLSETTQIINNQCQHPVCCTAMLTPTQQDSESLQRPSYLFYEDSQCRKC